MKYILSLVLMLFLTGYLLSASGEEKTMVTFEGFLQHEKENIGKLSINTLYDRAIKGYTGMTYYVKSLSNPIVRGYNLSSSPFNPGILENVYYMVKEVKFAKETFIYTYDIVNKGNRELTVLRWDNTIRLPNEEKVVLPPGGSVTIVYSPIKEVQNPSSIYRTLKTKDGRVVKRPIDETVAAKVIIYDSSGWAIFDPMPTRPEYTSGYYTGDDR
jgi:hypothetical protein